MVIVNMNRRKWWTKDGSDMVLNECGWMYLYSMMEADA